MISWLWTLTLRHTGMSGQNPESSDNRQLGSLAREAEQLRLKQSQAPDSPLLPATVHPADNAPVAAAEADRTAVGQPPATPSRGRLSMFPFGPFLALALVMLATFSGAVEYARASVIGAVIDGVGLNSNPEVYVLNHIDRIRTGANGNVAEMVREYNELASQVKSKFGDSDQLTCFVRLSLANEYIRQGHEPEARKIWQEQMQYIDHPQQHPPREITKLLVGLAEYYSSVGQDQAAARQFYLAAVKFYPFAPINNSLSNLEQDLAAVDLNLGYVAEANEYFKKTLALTLSWGNSDYNLYRLREVVRTDILLKHYADAIPYAERAVKMSEATQPLWANSDKQMVQWLRARAAQSTPGEAGTPGQ
jgi:tetratricopeptide (TPR) repeat protein